MTKYWDINVHPENEYMYEEDYLIRTFWMVGIESSELVKRVFHSHNTFTSIYSAIHIMYIMYTIKKLGIKITDVADNHLSL